MPVIPVKVDDETKARWQAAARRADQSLAAYVREAVDGRIAGPSAPVVAPVQGKAKAGATRARTGLCEHRRTPEQFCSRCDA